MVTSREILNVLWTGGVDSTFTMILLSRFSVDIQPHYLADNRRSEQNELNAIEDITGDLIKNARTKCTILPLKITKVTDVMGDQNISEAYKRLRMRTRIGSQYDWLARFAQGVPNLMLSLEKVSNFANSAAVRCILTYGAVKRVTNGDIYHFELDKTKSSEDLITVFGNFRLSPVWEYDKKDEVTGFERLGYHDSLRRTWFCHSPIDGRPCGGCNPCTHAIEEGMKWRFEKSALLRYKKRKYILDPLRTFLRMLPFEHAVKEARQKLFS